MKLRNPDASKPFSGIFSQEPIPVPAQLIASRRVLITGAGGSIGSALARAVAVYKPAQILLLDASEHALYQIDRELSAPHESILGSVCDAAVLEEVFERHRPQLIFHAAAFKHAPLMERHPFAAIENNTMGTFATAQTAIRYRAEQVILVSTDKAVDPISIMGASKRIAELIALALASPGTTIKAVRLGNVYASQGSVVPLFEEQMAQGKPVTVTHPEATRYFVTIEQAAALLLYALSKDFPNAILVPDLTKPIRIEEIAKTLLAQSGSQSQIVYTGLRPGERLHEQLLSSGESFVEKITPHLRAINSPAITSAEATNAVEELRNAVRQRNLNRLLDAVTALIPAYKPSEVLLESQAAAEYRA